MVGFYYSGGAHTRSRGARVEVLGHTSAGAVMWSSKTGQRISGAPSLETRPRYAAFTDAHLVTVDRWGGELNAYAARGFQHQKRLGSKGRRIRDHVHAGERIILNTRRSTHVWTARAPEKLWTLPGRRVDHLHVRGNALRGIRGANTGPSA